MRWRGPVTDRQMQVWLAFLRIYEHGDKGDLDMAGCVPDETQKRWEQKVSGAAHHMAAAQHRKKKAYEIAAQTGEDVGLVYDRLKNGDPT